MSILEKTDGHYLEESRHDRLDELRTRKMKLERGEKTITDGIEPERL